MSDAPADYTNELVKKLQGKGLSKIQVFKILALQRVCDEVVELANQGKIGDRVLFAIATIPQPTHQKFLADLSLRSKAPSTLIRELARLIKLAEKKENLARASIIWDFIFTIKERLENDVSKDMLLKQAKQFYKQIGQSEAVGQVEERRIVQFRNMELKAGKGLDVGTCNIVACGRKTDATTALNIQRDAFIDMSANKFTVKLLMKLGIEYTQHGGRIYVSGDHAFELANIFERETRRPMDKGIVSGSEPEALVVLSYLFYKILGRAAFEPEMCVFSVPADPVDARFDTIYHREVMVSALKRMGYMPKPLVEGLAVIYSELEKDEFTGIGISCGGGMFNICVAYKGIQAVAFSTARGGDWIDNSAAKALNLTSAQVCAVKESGIDIRKPTNRIEEAIGIYYRHLISQTVVLIRQRLEEAESMPSFKDPIKVVCAGGTALAGGFIETLRDELQKSQFPIPVSDVILASDALNSVAIGCLRAAEIEQDLIAPGAKMKEGVPAGKEDDELPATPEELDTALEQMEDPPLIGE